MKRLILFILLLTSNLSFGMFFMMEYHRYSEMFYFREYFSPYTSFYFSDHAFSDIRDEHYITDNEGFWKNYCKQKVDLREIKEVLYECSENNFDEIDNQFIKYLKKTKDTEALKYLKQAIKCSSLNTFGDFSEEYKWGTNDTVNRSEKIRKICFDELVSLAFKSKTVIYQKRYAFLAIRLAYYSGFEKEITKIFEQYFSHSIDNDYVYYWSLYFRAMIEKDIVKKNYFLALVFNNNSDKNLASLRASSSSTPIAKIMNYAQNNTEKACILAFRSLQSTELMLKSLNEIYKLAPDLKILPFLCFREVSKIRYNFIWTNYKGQLSQNLSVKDIEYAKKLILLINSLNLKTDKEKTIQEYMTCSLLFFSGQFTEYMKQSKLYIKKYPTETETIDDFEQLNVFAEIETSKHKHLSLESERIILKNTNNQSFKERIMHALYKFNFKADAMFVFAADTEYTFRANISDSEIYLNGTFDNLKTIKQLLADYTYHKGRQTPYAQWFIKTVGPQLNALYGKIAESYLVENKLDSSLHYLNKIDQRLFNFSDIAWEKIDVSENEKYSSIYEGIYFSTISLANPFSSIINTPQFITNRFEFTASAKSIVEKMIWYREQIKSTKDKKLKSELLIELGNCYMNLSSNGDFRHIMLIGSDGFVYAKNCYLEAYKCAVSKKMKALSLKLVSFANDNRINRFYHFSDKKPTSENYYQKLRNEFPEYSSELNSNCEAFSKYWAK